MEAAAKDLKAETEGQSERALGFADVRDRQRKRKKENGGTKT